MTAIESSFDSGVEALSKRLSRFEVAPSLSVQATVMVIGAIKIDDHVLTALIVPCATDKRAF